MANIEAAIIRLAVGGFEQTERSIKKITDPNGKVIKKEETIKVTKLPPNMEAAKVWLKARGTAEFKAALTQSKGGGNQALIINGTPADDGRTRDEIDDILDAMSAEELKLLDEMDLDD